MLSLSVSTILYYLYFDISEFQAKKEAHLTLVNHTNNLQVFKIPTKQLKQNGQDEIWHDGKLYDIASCKINGDTATIYVLHDKEEESIISRITDYLKADCQYVGNDGYNHIGHRHAPVIKEYKYITSNYHFKNASFFSLNDFHQLTTAYFSNNCRTVITPPPKA